MPQMSPLNWLTIFLMLLFLLMMNISIFPKFQQKAVIKFTIKSMQKSMKW